MYGCVKEMYIERQWIIYLFGIILAILIGVFVSQSEDYGQWEGIFCSGITLFASMIVASLIFGKHSYVSAVLLVGISSLILTAFGSFNTFDLFFTIIIAVFIASIVVGISLYVQE